MNIQRAIEILKSGLITEQEQVELVIILYKIQAEEREACAKVCDEHAKESWDQEGGALNCADKIRARENT